MEERLLTSENVIIKMTHYSPLERHPYFKPSPEKHRSFTRFQLLYVLYESGMVIKSQDTRRDRHKLVKQN